MTGRESVVVMRAIVNMNSPSTYKARLQQGPRHKARTRQAPILES